MYRLYMHRKMCMPALNTKTGQNQQVEHDKGGNQTFITSSLLVDIALS